MSLELPKLPDVPRLPSISDVGKGRRGRPEANRPLLYQLIREFPDYVDSKGKRHIQTRRIIREYFQRTGQKISRYTVLNARKELARLGEKPPVEESVRFQSRREYLENELIKLWASKLSQSGVSDKTIKNYQSGLYQVLKAVRVSPESFQLAHLQKFNGLMKEKGLTDEQVKGYNVAGLSFLGLVKGVVIPKGAGKALGVPRPCISGKYAGVMLTKSQIPRVAEAIEEDDYRLAFELAVKSGARAEALTKIPLERIEIIDFDGVKVLKYEVFESKVKEADEWKGEKGKFWRKYLPLDDKLAGQLLKRKAEREAQGFETVFDNGSWLNGLWKVLKDAYRKAEVKEPYAYKKPTHFLRHTFAQLMLEATGWNYDIVAELGGWETTLTLKKYYGAPPEAVKARVACEAIPKMVI